MIKEFILNILIRLIAKFMEEEVVADVIRIWDKVKFLSSTKNIAYVVYSITYYYWGRVEYTLWVDDEYERCEAWQITKFNDEQKIGFITPYEVHVWE